MRKLLATVTTTLVFLVVLSFGLPAETDSKATPGSSSNDSNPLSKYNVPLDLGPQGEEVRLSLREAVAIAVRNNLSVEGYRYSLLAAKEQVNVEDAAFDHAFFAEIPLKREKTASMSSPTPTISTQTGYTFGFKRRFRTGTYYQVQITDEYTHYNTPLPGNRGTLLLTVAHPLLRNAGRKLNSAKFEIAANMREMERLELEAQLNSLIYDIANAYWNLALARDRLEVALNGKRLAEELYRTTENLVRSGAEKRLALLRAESGVASREEDVHLSRLAARSAEDALKMLLNLNRDGSIPDTKVLLTDRPMETEIVCSFDSFIRFALDRRPDLRKARLRLVLGKIGLDTAKNQLLPKVDFSAVFALTGIGSDYGDNWEGLVRGDYYSWQVGLNIEFPLGNRAAKASLRKAEYEFNMVKTQVLTAEQAVIMQIRNLIRTVRTNYRRIHSATIDRELKQRSLEEEQERYRVGRSTSIEVLRFQTDLIMAQNKELQAKIDYNLAIAQLNKARSTNLLDFRIDVEDYLAPTLPLPGWNEDDAYKPLVEYKNSK